ncbi:hypothetical protein [Pseudomonas sp. BAY1663]|uniref:hypothetical protein n=1 Tax=Pseudomonas sp. BAY1663 TaxID=1439940 RepID=UPI00210DEDF7|nr:hypothetical protein [Pseudomonas sp. BAY1663]
MAQGQRALAVEAARIGAASGQVLGDAFNRGQIGRLVVETKFSSYATHKVLTGFAVGECDWRVKHEVQVFARLRFARFASASQLLHQNK